MVFEDTAGTYVDNQFALIQRAIQRPPHNLFASTIRYLERRWKVRIAVAGTAEVRRGTAFASSLPGEKVILILVNSDDMREHPNLTRFLTAHELGHIAMAHHEERRMLTRWELGSDYSPNPVQSQYHEASEAEADLFGADMLYANGEVVERHILSEQEYADEFGTQTASPLSDSGYRRAVVRDLQVNGHLKHPIPIICQSLGAVLADGTLDGERYAVARQVHERYRAILKERRLKPLDTVERFRSDACLSCPIGNAGGDCEEIIDS